MIAAPGNAIRSSLLPNRYNLSLSISSSFKSAFSYAFDWLRHPPIFLFTILYIPVGTKISHTQKSANPFSNIHPLLSLFLFTSLMIAVSFPYWWSTGNESLPGRVVNVIYLLFLIGWFLTLQICIQFLRTRYNVQFGKLPNYVSLAITIFIAISLMNGNIKTAYENLLDGRAYRYNKELNKRYETIQHCEVDICDVTALESRPIIFFDDIAEDEKDWRNKCYSQYFHKKAVRLRKTFDEKNTPKN